MFTFVKANAENGIYYKEYSPDVTAENDVMATKAEELAGQFSVPGFRAKYMIVITWYRMEQNINPPAPSQVPWTTHRNYLKSLLSKNGGFLNTENRIQCWIKSIFTEYSAD